MKLPRSIKKILDGDFKGKRKLIPIAIILVFVLLILYHSFMIYTTIANNNLVSQAIQISDNNQHAVFKIKKVLVYSSADAIDNTDNNSLKSLDISQFSDIAVYIDNTSYISELTPENTVKDLSISNISITNNSGIGKQSLTYKNPLDFAKLKLPEENIDSNNTTIKYTTLYTNEEQSQNNYTYPTFFTDCSDPITLSYVNKNVVTNYSLPDNSNVPFNGKLLEQAKVNLDDLKSEISFNINITNNQNEKFTYNIKLNVSLDSDNGGIYNGYLFQGKEASGDAYNFFKTL